MDIHGGTLCLSFTFIAITVQTWDSFNDFGERILDNELLNRKQCMQKSLGDTGSVKNLEGSIRAPQTLSQDGI